MAALLRFIAEEPGMFSGKVTRKNSPEKSGGRTWLRVIPWSGRLLSRIRQRRQPAAPRKPETPEPT